MDILDDMGVSKLSVKVFLKVNYSFNTLMPVMWINWQKNQCVLYYCKNMQIGAVTDIYMDKK